MSRAQQAGVLDDLEIQLVPLLSVPGGRCSARSTPPRPLELVRVLEAPSVTHLRYRVAR